MTSSFKVSIAKVNLNLKTENAGFVLGHKKYKHFHLIEELFEKSKTLEKLRKQKDRICEFFLYNGNPVGIIVYKKENQTDESLNIKNSLAVKNLVVFNKTDESKAFQICLLKRLCRVAEKNNAFSIHMKVKTDDENINHFLFSNEFKIVENSENADKKTHILKRDASKYDKLSSKRKRSSKDI